MRRRELILGLSAVPVLGTLSFASTAYALRVGARAPELGADDRFFRRVYIHSLKGSVVAVNFWANWSTASARSFPVLEALYGLYRARGLVVIGVAAHASDDTITEFLARHPVSFTILADGSRRISARYAPPSIASSFVIDRGGIVRSIHDGFESGTAAALDTAITALL